MTAHPDAAAEAGPDVPAGVPAPGAGAAAAAPPGDPGVRPCAVWQPRLAEERRPDGTRVLRRLDPLGPVDGPLSARLDRWAAERPDATWMAERPGPGAEGWRRVGWASLRERARAVGQWCLERGLSAERPLLILSRNSLDHAVAALGAQYAGIPSAAISPAYSLASTDHAKLRAIAARMTPGAVLVQEAAPFAAALRALDPAVPVVAVEGEAEGGRETVPFADLLATRPTPALDAAHAAIGPDTVVKFLFTSGTTGQPKAVIQTDRMLCANQAMIADCYRFMEAEPPVFVDWAPWNHTAAGNKVFNMTLWHGGTYHVDGGRPGPAGSPGMAETIRNLREVSPTWYFNVPVGFHALVDAMEEDGALRASFFRRLRMMMYAGAGLDARTWARLGELAVRAVGQRVLMTTGLGSTETAPFALYCTDEQAAPGNVGIPARGVELKLVPQGERTEARLRGPNVTPGYWRDPETTAAAFDAEGFYRLGDALREAVPGRPEAGFAFDGRIAENFKLSSGTWVAVGPLRAALVDALGGLAADAVIAGEGRDDLGALLVPHWPGLRALAPGVADAALPADPRVRAALEARLAGLAARATGSSTRVVRAALLAEPLSLDAGEVTDKGSVNQRAVLRRRAGLVAALWEGADGLRLAPWA